ncbi:MATE family efflux transporter [Candidatus Hepatincolaceae symbiont of Richtersius coronifer]
MLNPQRSWLRLIKDNAFFRQLLFIFLILSIEFSITSIDFIFLEKISYKAAIGVAALIPFIYIIQGIFTQFCQSMVNNCVYLYAKNDSTVNVNYNNTLFAGFIISILLSLILVTLLFIFKDNLFFIFKKSLDDEAKKYALKYIIYMIPFFILLNMEQYFSYILYSLNLARFKFLFIIAIFILNILFNYLAVEVFQAGVSGIAISSSLSVLAIFPLYLYALYRFKILYKLKISLHYYKKAYVGIKNLGFAGVLDPILHYIVQFFISAIIVKIGVEMISAKQHAQNYLIFSLTASLSIAIMMQLRISKLFGQSKPQDFKNIRAFYNKNLKAALSLSILFTLAAFIFVYFTLHLYENWYSSNQTVRQYLIICMILAILVEPLRTLSIVSKAYLKGLQNANWPLIVSILNKMFITLPLCYAVIFFTSLGLAGIFLVEGFSYLVNFILYLVLAKTIYKKRKKNIDNF